MFEILKSHEDKYKSILCCTPEKKTPQGSNNLRKNEPFRFYFYYLSNQKSLQNIINALL